MALKELLTDLSNFKYTDYDNVGANNSQIKGRHGGYKGGGEPPHPEEHSKLDDKSGINLSKIKGRHGGYEGGGEPPHPKGHSLLDDRAGENLSKIKGRHGGTEGPTPAQPPHPNDHSLHDDGVGFGVAPNDNPQSFDVRGYTITGTKTFDRPNQDAITIMTNRVGFPYTPFDSGVKTGPVNFLSGVYGSWGTETLPLGFSFNMVDSLLSPGIPPVLSLNTLRHTIPEVGPSPEFTIDYSRYDELLGSQFNTVDGIISSQYTDTEKLHSSYGTQFHVSGFNRGDMYIPDHPEPSIPEFKQFTRGHGGLQRYNNETLLEIGRFDGIEFANDRFFIHPDRRPYNFVFKGVTPWAPMWVTDPVTGAKSNIDVTLDSTQPYIVRRIGDRWGLYEGDPEDGGEHLSGAIEWANALSGEFFRAPIDVMVDRSVADIGRIAKFLTSTKGALFLGKQFILQAFNPTIETKLYNPLSLGSVVPMVHVNRHAGGKRYTDVVPSDSAVQALADLMPGVEIGPIGVSGADIINAGLDVVGYDVPSFGRVEMQSPLATIHGEKIPLDKRVALSNPNRFLWPGALGFSTGTDAAISEASKIQKSQDIVLGRAKGQSDGGIKDLFQKTSFNKYDGGDNVYLTADGIMGTPEAEGPFGFLANLPISFSQLESQVTNALTDWASKKVADITGKKKSPEVEPLNPPPHRFDLLEQTNKSIPISGPLLNSPLVKVMDSYYPGMEGSYSFPNQLGGDLWPEYGYDYKYPIEFQGTPLIAGTTLPFAWGVSLARYATGDDTKHEGWTSWKISGASDIQPKLKDGDSPLAQTIVLGDNQEENWYEPGYGGTWNYFPKHNSLIGDGDARVWYGLSDDKTVHIDTGTGYPEATAKHTFAIPGSSRGMKFYITTPIDEPDGQTFGGISRGDRIFNDSFVGNLYKYDKEGKSDGGAYYWHKDKGLITNETYLTISSGESVHAKNNLPSAEKIIFYGDAPGTRIGYGLDTATFGDRIKVDNGFQGDLYGPFRNTALTEQGKDKYFDSTGRIPSEPLVTEGDEPIYIGHVGSIRSKSTIIHNFGIHTHGTVISGITDFDPSGDKRPSKIFGKEIHNMTRISATNLHFGGNIYSRTPGGNYLARVYAVDPSLKEKVGALANRYEGHTEAPLGEWPKGLASIGLGTDFQGNIFEKKDKGGTSTAVFATDLYSDTVTYGSLYKKYEAIAETEPHKFRHTRLILDDKGEPQLTYSLAHLSSNLAAADSKALQLTAETTVPIKDKVITLDQYKDFPWSTLFLVGRSPINFLGNLYGPTGRKRYGFITYSENVSLPQMGPGESPISYKRRLTPVQQKIWQRQRIDDMKRRIRDEKEKLGVSGGSLSITTVKKVENGEETSKFEVITVEGADGKDVVIPTVVKAKVSRNDLAPQATEPDPDATFKDDTGQVAPAVINVPEQSVNVLDKPDILTEAGAETPPVPAATQQTSVPAATQQNQENIVPTQTTPTGNQTALKKYKTLVYGDLGKEDTKYGKQWASGGELVETGFQGKMTAADAQQVLDDRKGGSGKVWNMGNPGTPGVTQVYDPELGAAVKLKGAEIGSGYDTDLVDKINMHPYGKEDLPAGVDDFIKFKFKDLINKKYIIFRAALSGISETIQPDWSSERYIGRPDNVHVYQGVDRSMSFEFQVFPTSRQELPILWEKMNYLVGLTYPTWKKIGFGNRMEAPFFELTIGDMWKEVPGFLSSLTVTIDDNSPWETIEKFQLPHAISVGCEFTHIGKHPLASQGKHYDLGWLREYKQDTVWSQDGESQLGKRGMLGPSSDKPNSLFKTGGII